MSKSPTTPKPLRITVSLFGRSVDMTSWFTQFGEALISPTRDDGSDKSECRKS